MTRREHGRMGLQAYARILASLRDTPGTAWDLAERFNRGRQRMGETLWRLERGGFVHVSDWVPNLRGRGMLIPRFVFGPGTSAPYPVPLRRKTHGVGLVLSDPRPELVGFMSILRAMEQPVSRAELREATGYSHHRLSELLRCMRALGLVHVAGWNTERIGNPAQLFQFGAGADVRKPRPKSRAEIGRDFRARKNAAAAQRMLLLPANSTEWRAAA